MTVMVISYFDLAGKRELKPNGQTTNVVFIKHLDYWYYQVVTANVKNKTDSYLCDEQWILSKTKVKYSAASGDAKKCIAKIRNFVKTSMMDTPTIHDFLSNVYQRVLLSTMRTSFNELDYYEPEIRTLVQHIANFVRRRFTDLLLMAICRDRL
jgi:hypothetical protein